MIKAILIFNNHGKPRLSKFYQYYNESQQQQIIKETFQVGWLVLRIQMELKKNVKITECSPSPSWCPRETTMFATFSREAL